MANQPGVWGIDLGQCALKAVRLEEIDGQVTATAFDYVEHPKILSQPDADPEQLTREALEKFLSRNSLKGDTVAISVPGQSGLARFVKLPPVEEKKITDIVRFEAKQQIPFNLDEVVWDFQKITSGVVSDGFAMETEIGLFAMKRDMVSRYLGHFKEVNVEVHLVQMAPLALCNYVSYDLLKMNADGSGGEDEEGGGKKRCVVALDIGADSANLVITDGKKIIWQRPIPLGGNHFTRALTKDMKLTFAKAEHLKRNATKSPDLKKILASLKPVLNDFVGEVQRSLGYFTNTHRDAQIEYMVGLGNAFRLPGLQRFLAEKLQLDVRKLTSFERLAGDEVISQPTYTENVASLAVAYGLGLQGLKATRLQTNLLPPEIQVERMVRAKKPMAAAAAAALLAGVGLLTLGYAMELRAYGSVVMVEGKPDPSNIVEKAKLDAAAAVKKDKELESNYTTLLGKVAEEEKQVKQLIAGKEERIDWMALHRFISEALPRKLDNGDLFMLNTVKKAQIWNEMAKHAHKKLEERINSAKGPLGKDDIDETYAHLAQINITGFDCRYTANMADCWATLKMDDKESEERRASVRAPIEDRTTKTVKPPDAKPGWLVELRGYTYNAEGRRYIIDGLVDNLAGLGGAKEATPADSKAAASTPADATAKKDPVKGQISHVFVYEYDRYPATSRFGLAASGGLTSIAGGGGGGGRGAGMAGVGGDMQQKMSQSIMGKGMAGGAGASGGMMGAAMMGGAGMTGGTGSTGGSSTGMSGGAGASGGGGGGTAGTAKDFSSLITPSGGTGQGEMPLGAGAKVSGTGTARRGGAPAVDNDKPSTNTTNTTNTPAPKDKPDRFEFVVLFFWNEAVPSDPLMDFKQDLIQSSGSGGATTSGGGAGLPGKGAGK
jgi:type IV pilus assembly protein PilM